MAVKLFAMKKEFLLPLLGLAIACSSPEEDIPSPESNNNQIPVPTKVVEDMADEKAYEEKREAYFDLIHSSSDPVDWKAVNQSNFEEKDVAFVTHKGTIYGSKKEILFEKTLYWYNSQIDIGLSRF